MKCIRRIIYQIVAHSKWTNKRKKDVFLTFKSQNEVDGNICRKRTFHFHWNRNNCLIEMRNKKEIIARKSKLNLSDHFTHCFQFHYEKDISEELCEIIQRFSSLFDSVPNARRYQQRIEKTFQFNSISDLN